jgi:arsenite methyltransferase
MSYKQASPETIKEQVRRYYAERIQSSSCCGSPSGCGGDAVPTEIALYGAEVIAALPSGVVTTSFGCGNPVALASLQEGEIVLDLGSGGGLDALLAAQRVGVGGYVYGIDMTDNMLAVARRNAEKAGVANVEFLKGDIENIPLPANVIDVIISNCVINLTPDKSQALHEAFRVLKPGGRLAVSDIVIDGDLTGFPVSEEQIRAALDWAGCVAGALTIDEYRALLTEAGFIDTAITVQHRYTIDEVGAMLAGAPGDLNALPPEVVQGLVGCFTSSTIEARKPVSERGEPACSRPGAQRHWCAGSALVPAVAECRHHRSACLTARQRHRNDPGCQHEGDGEPETTDQSPDLIHRAGEHGSCQASQGIRHVVEPDPHRGFVALGVGENEIGVHR